MTLTNDVGRVEERSGLPTVLPSPKRPRRLARPRTPPFHGDNTGSNPVGDAKLDSLVWKSPNELKAEALGAFQSHPRSNTPIHQERAPPEDVGGSPEWSLSTGSQGQTECDWRT